MLLSGQLKVLSFDDMEAVHEKILQLLETKGMVFASAETLETFRVHGAKVEDRTVFLPREMVQEALSLCPSTFLLEGLDQAYNVTVGEGLLIHPAGGEVYVKDYDAPRRAPLLKDFADLQKLYQYCENIDIGGYQPLSPSDVPERVKGLYCMEESFCHCTKPLLNPMELDTVMQKEECIGIYNAYYGTENYTDNHYVTWHAVCPNSPWFYSDFACEGIRVYAEHNQPVTIVSAPMTGITSPVHLLSAVVLSLAEMIAGLVYAQLLRPGVPVVLSASLTYGNLRYASWECASPDTALMLGATVQMFRDFYHLPARAQTGVTSSKCIDYQAGAETMQSFLLTALSGVHLTSQSAGTLGNLMISSLEKTVLDDETIGRVRHILKGMNTEEAAFGMKELLAAEPCTDFLTEPSTLEHFRDGWQPVVSDWQSVDGWEESGSQDVLETAHNRVKEILSGAPECQIDEARKTAVREYIRCIEKQNGLL